MPRAHIQANHPLTAHLVTSTIAWTQPGEIDISVRSPSDGAAAAPTMCGSVTTSCRAACGQTSIHACSGEKSARRLQFREPAWLRARNFFKTMPHWYVRLPAVTSPHVLLFRTASVRSRSRRHAEQQPAAPPALFRDPGGFAPADPPTRSRLRQGSGVARRSAFGAKAALAGPHDPRSVRAGSLASLVRDPSARPSHLSWPSVSSL